MHVLVIDDDVRICAFIAATATTLGWTVDTAVDQKAFEALLAGRQPDAVIVDLQLGAADGIEVLRFMGTITYPGSVVLISGFDDRVLAAAQDVGISFGLDIAEILEKPIRAVTIQGLLTVLEQRSSKRPPLKELVTATALPKLTSQDIDHAIAADEMVLYFQPVLNAGSLDVTGLEALIRWQHPTLGLVPPDQFIPIAEQNEQTIENLTMWVIRNALAQRRIFERAQVSVPIAVNVSGVNLRHLEFPDQVAQQVDQAGFTSKALTFEVTESIATTDASRTADILTRLRLKGFELAIDDLGTGYSSLRALRQIPFSSLKIDKSFVSEAEISRDALSIVRSIIDLSRNMRLGSVAEGVETASVAKLMTQLGIDSMQGYHFTRPLPAGKLIEWMVDRNKVV